MTQQKLTRSKVRKAVLSRRGTLAAIARRFNVSMPHASNVLKGRTVSAEIYAAFEAEAAAILQAEAGAAA